MASEKHGAHETSRSSLRALEREREQSLAVRNETSTQGQGRDKWYYRVLQENPFSLQLQLAPIPKPKRAGPVTPGLTVVIVLSVLFLIIVFNKYCCFRRRRKKVTERLERVSLKLSSHPAPIEDGFDKTMLLQECASVVAIPVADGRQID